MGHEQEKFELNMTSDERALDTLLSDALHMDVPDGLSARVWQASQESIGATQMDAQLNRAYEQRVSPGFTERVFDSSAPALHQPELQIESPAIIARIGVTIRWQQVAIAASLLLTTLIAIRFSLPQQSEIPTRTLAASWELSVEEEGLLLDDFEMSEYAYLADTRELAFADVADSFNSVRRDIELWQYGLLTD